MLLLKIYPPCDCRLRLEVGDTGSWLLFPSIPMVYWKLGVYNLWLNQRIYSSECSDMTSHTVADWGSFILHGVNPTGKEIGRGAYGRVFEVDYEGTLCAAKEVHALLLQYSRAENLHKIEDDFLSECQIWSTLRHPCVVQFLGSVILVVNIYE